MIRRCHRLNIWISSWIYRLNAYIYDYCYEFPNAFSQNIVVRKPKRKLSTETCSDCIMNNKGYLCNLGARDSLKFLQYINLSRKSDNFSTCPSAVLYSTVLHRRSTEHELMERMNMLLRQHAAIKAILSHRWAVFGNTAVYIPTLSSDRECYTWSREKKQLCIRDLRTHESSQVVKRDSMWLASGTINIAKVQ
jgi:hypothetical protein